MAKIAIVFHSAHGHTRALAKAISLGIAAETTNECVLLDLLEQQENFWDIIKSADAIVFGSPTYMGTVSATFKAFMDATGRFWLHQPWKNKVAAGFTISTSESGDKLGTLTAMMVFAMQHGMIWVGQDHVGSVYTKDGMQINQSGSWVGLMARSNPDKSKLIFDGDFKTAVQFGERVALVARKLL